MLYRAREQAVDVISVRPLNARTTIPLNWMPWQRHMLNPYLLPPELPESQLVELHEYAMSFVERNDFDLIDSLIDMNQSIYLSNHIPPNYIFGSNLYPKKMYLASPWLYAP